MKYNVLYTHYFFDRGSPHDAQQSHSKDHGAGVFHMAALGEEGACPHRSHKKLENLKHLWLQGNKLSQLPLMSKEESPSVIVGDDSGGEQSKSSTQTVGLIF